MMKPLLYALLISMAWQAGFAATAEEIEKAFQKKASAACEKMDATLMREGTAVAAQQVLQGDTAAATLIAGQVKAKVSGKEVAHPHSALTSMFISYDSAKRSVLKPIQEASLREVEAELQRRGGKNINSVLALGRVREKILMGSKNPGEAVNEEEERASGRDLPKGEPLFVEKAWLSAAGTEYYFNKDHTGYRLHGRDKTPLTWKMGGDNVVEAAGFMKPEEPALFFFKFQDEDHGIFGRQSLRFMKDPIVSKRASAKK